MTDDLRSFITEQNNRLKASNLQPVLTLQEHTNEQWKGWTKYWDQRLAEDCELLKQDARPKHEEWTDFNCERWVADGTGKLYNVNDFRVIHQSEAASLSFMREIPLEGSPADLKHGPTHYDWQKVYNWAEKLNITPDTIERLKQEHGQIFGQGSWWTITRVRAELLNIQRLYAGSEKLEKQAVERTKRESKRSEKHFVHRSG